MWRNYSLSYIRQNRGASISIAAAALIGSLFLSMLGSLFYHMWQYDNVRIRLEEGSYEERLTVEVELLGEEVLEKLGRDGNVKTVLGYLDKGRGVIDITFVDRRQAFSELPRIARQAGLEEANLSWHETLLAQYLVYNPQGGPLFWVFRFYLAVLAVTAFVLVLIIRNAFWASMTARVRQLGILSSIGATPGQLRICLLQEAMALCLLPILLGSFGGLGLAMGFLRLTEWIGRDVERISLPFTWHPLVLCGTLALSVLTVFASAWFPAVKMSKMTPLETLHTCWEEGLRRKKRSLVLGRLFGMEGELAGNSLKARKRSLRTTSLSLTLSLFCLGAFLCFMTLSDISTRYTYFFRYQDVWDVMAQVQGADLTDFPELLELRELPEVKSCVAYQKAETFTLLSREQLSEEFLSLGGPGELEGDMTPLGEAWLVKMPLVILDDASFGEYLKELSLAPQFDGVVVRNRIRDSVNSNFRYPILIPFLRDQERSLRVTDALGGEVAGEVKILALTEQEPVLREEYLNGTLTIFLPASLWDALGHPGDQVGMETQVRFLLKDKEAINQVEEQVGELLSGAYETETENRIQEKISNSQMLDAYRAVVSGFCAILGLIGIANIFTNTLGFLFQRKREFARYLSVGVTPGGIRKILWIEALVIAGRPVLIAVLAMALFTTFFIKMSYLNPAEFLAEAPFLPLGVYVALIFGFVGLAYYWGGRRLLHSDLSEALRDNTMV